MRFVLVLPRRRVFRLLVTVLALVGAFLAGAAARADDPADLRGQATGLEQENVALDEQENAALLELYALETSLGRAERRLSALRSEAGAVARETAEAERHLELARQAESVAQQQLGNRLTALYVEGDVDALAVILGAGSLDEAISAVDGLSRLAEEDDRIIRQAQVTRVSLRSALRNLGIEEARLRGLLATAETARDNLARATGEKETYLASLARQRDLNTEQIADLEAAAQSAEQRSAEIEASAAETTVQDDDSRAAPEGTRLTAPVAAPTSGRQLTVDAVAYSLPGYTASGLPVGKGVVAVDPSVIPLGTRLYVPGYGPAIAADVGTAIIGNIIDLWFPTYEQAAAWGRKTVTITIYGSM